MNVIALLWLPILVAAVFVFIASALVHMVLKWHAPDYRGFSNEDDVADALRKGNPAPGIYVVPYCSDMKDMASLQMQEKFRRGPIAKITLRAGQAPSMGKPLAQWFVYCLFVSLLCALIAAPSLGVNASSHVVFHTTGLAAILGYAFGSFVQGIWWGQPWSAVFKDSADGILYAIITGATFAWLWPH